MTWIDFGAVLAGGTAAALVLRWLRLPMWPIAGGLLGAALVHLILGHGSWAMPDFASPIAQILVGSAVGCAITMSIFRDFARVLVPGTIAVIVIVAAGLLLGIILGLLDLLPIPVAVLGMIPGGVGEMVAGAVSLHTDSATVAGIHLVRLLAVIWSLPLLVRAVRWLGDAGQDDTKD